MCAEKTKPEEDEVTDQQLEDVAGGLAVPVPRIVEAPTQLPTKPPGESEGDLGDSYLLSQLSQLASNDPSNS